ncbi:MAG: EutN/CcmL family microcompartment protein [Polyangia bacterium]
MIHGRVIGEVWATRKAPGLTGRRLLLVGVDGEDRAVVAIDTLDAREGEAVLVSVGSGARNVLQPGPDNRALLCDAAISLIIDGEG